MRTIKLWCYIAVFVILQCCYVLCTGAEYNVEDGPYFSIQHCYGSEEPAVLTCTDRGYGTIQILDVSVEDSARENCSSERSSNSTAIPSIINETSCHKEAMQRLHTVCAHKERCEITDQFLDYLLPCFRWDLYAWIIYKCQQEDNVPQVIILCQEVTVIAQQMCQPGTGIETIGAMFADEYGNTPEECNCCSRFGDCFLDVDNETMVAIHSACDGKQTCDELKLNVPTEWVTCGGSWVYIDYTAIYYRCISEKETTQGGTLSTRIDIGTTRLSATTKGITEPRTVIREVTFPDTSYTDSEPTSGTNDLHQSSNLGVAVGVPAAVFLLAIVVVTVVMVLIVRRRRQKKAGKAATHVQSEGASAEDNAIYVNQGHGVHFHAGTIGGDNHRDSAIENGYIVFEETVSPSKDNHPEHAPDSEAYYSPEWPYDVQPEGSVAQAATIQEDRDSSNPYELTLTDNQLYDFNDNSEEKGDRGGATKRGPLNDVYTLAEPRGGKPAQPEETVLDQTPLKNTKLGPVTGEIYSLPITHDVEMLDNDAYAT